MKIFKDNLGVHTFRPEFGLLLILVGLLIVLGVRTL